MKLISSTLIFVFALLSINTVSALTYLNENNTWQQNLTKVAHGSSIFGDINNDNYLDLVLAGTCGTGCYIIKVYINNGTSLVENQTWEQNLTAINYGSIAFGDINNDGNLDLVLSGCSSGGGIDSCTNPQTLVYINNGTSLVENQTWEQNLEKVGESSLAFGDINNDGDLDLAISGYTNNPPYIIAKIYINNGTSLVENQTWEQNVTAVNLGSLSFGDINGDGKLDLAITGRNSDSQKTTKIYINNGTSFLENYSWEQNLVNVDESSLSFGDIDNDDKLDLTFIGCCDRHRIYKNTGTSFVETEKETTSGGNLAGIFAGSLAWGDYNNDGELDLITTGREGATTLYVNNNSNFSSYSQDPESQIADIEWSSVNWVDLDEDKDLDIVLFGWKSSIFYAKVYTNNITSQNNIPNSPTSNFNSTFNFSTGKLALSWGNGSDIETPTLGLYYNLRVGTCPGCHDVVSGVYGGSSNPTAGYFGNMMQRKRIVLNRPDLENKTIYWAVQTIDTGLAKSTWSAEQINYITQQCTENWSYGEWSSCINNQQTRTATDLNGCGTTVNKSATTQSCTSYTPPSGGGTYTPPAVKNNETNGTDGNTGSSGTNMANSSGNASSGANIGSMINRSNKTVKICVPFDVICEENSLLECAASGMGWAVKQICEFGCENGECKEKPKELIDYAWIILPIAAIIVSATGFYLIKAKKPGASAAPVSPFP